MKYKSTKKIVLKNAASMPLWDVNNKKKKWKWKKNENEKKTAWRLLQDVCSRMSFF